MNIVTRLLAHINASSKSEFERQILYVLLGIVLLCVGIYSIFANASQSYAASISSLHAQAKNAGMLRMRFAQAEQEKHAITQLLHDNKTFEIKSFVENFFRDQGIKPSSDWVTIASKLPGNDQLEELSLKVRVSGQSMENVVQLLANLEATEIVYVRELDLEKQQGPDNSNKVALELVLATLRFTSRHEE